MTVLSGQADDGWSLNTWHGYPLGGAALAGGAARDVFAAWWPDAPTTEKRENASRRGGVKGVTTILQDGSRHSVSLEELTGRTSAQLNTPATGGSAPAFSS
ncbi:hypothetical protein [Nonomuraea sp. NPDC050786]|uniref:hypothetical protein n=1 Tax=Nonomuraea sp. NPDC050786 TaxID=3154840 RepID=UPI0034032EC9